jgi:dipeptidase
MTLRQRFNRLILLGSLCVIVSLNGLADDGLKLQSGCFSMVVGKEASADGSVMFAHNEDAIAPAVNIYKVPELIHNPGEQETLPYLWLNVTTCDMCASYMNEYGVTIGSDECPSKEDKPELKGGGIGFWLRRIVAERARTAREGVKIAGGLISELGYAFSGRSYVIADQNEGWILAVVKGKRWVAERVPDDQVAIIPNNYTIQRISLIDTVNFLGSPDIIEYAARRGWYDPSTDGEFNFAKAYSSTGAVEHPGNTHRVWRALDLVSGKKYDIKKQLPFAAKPAQRLVPHDLMRVLSDRYEGTDLGEPVQGTICHDGTMYSFVAQIRSWLPAEIKSVMWVAMCHPDLQAYSAWYPSIRTVPETYGIGDYALGLQEQLDRSIVGHKKEKSPAFTAFVSLDAKVRENSAAYAADIKQAWKSYQEKNIKEQDEFERKIIGLEGQDPREAIKVITDHTAAKATEIFRKADELLKSLD